VYKVVKNTIETPLSILLYSNITKDSLSGQDPEKVMGISKLNM